MGAVSGAMGLSSGEWLLRRQQKAADNVTRRPLPKFKSSGPPENAAVLRTEASAPIDRFHEFARLVRFKTDAGDVYIEVSTSVGAGGQEYALRNPLIS